MNILLKKTSVKKEDLMLTNKAILKEAFELKTVTYLIGSPDEIANALVDEKTRSMWDPNVKTIIRNNDDTIKITYGAHSLVPLNETINYSFICDKEGQHYFISEFVNGETYRYYELSPVLNRPYFMRVTQYMKVTPKIFNVRGKDVYRSLNGLKNFVSQLNRTSEMSIVLKKHNNQDNEESGEMLASLRNTMFTDVVEETNMIEQSEIVIREGDASDDELNQSEIEGAGVKQSAQQEQEKKGGEGEEEKKEEVKETKVVEVEKESMELPATLTSP